MCKPISGQDNYISDHLGNNRVVFTTAPKTHEFTLNYESDPNLPDDEGIFDELTNIITANIHDHTDAGTTYDQVQLLNGATNGVIGSVLTIPVGAGDKVSAEVYAKYLASTGTNNPAAAIGNLVIGAITGSTGTNSYEGAINSGYGTNGTVTNLIHTNASSTEPMAFINVLFLPDDVTNTIESSHFAFKQITSASSNSQAILALDQPYEAPEAGYVVVYLSNESAQLTEVYFDDLKVTVEEHPVIQSDDFYPFGGQFNSYQRVTAKENRYKFNQGTGDKKFRTERITDLELNLDMTKYRMYDYSTGRFTSIDPLADEAGQEIYSTYQYGYNNPISNSDPYGDCPGCKTFLRATKGFIEDKLGSSSTAERVKGVLDVGFGMLEGLIADPLTDAVDMANQATALGESIAEGNIEGIIANSPTLAADVKATSDMVNDAVDGDERAQGQVAATVVATVAGGKPKNITKTFSTRKIAKNARPKPKPAKKGAKQVTRQTKNKSGEGNKMKTDRGSQTLHFHDRNHGNKKKQNVHYRTTKKYKPEQ